MFAIKLRHFQGILNTVESISSSISLIATFEKKSFEKQQRSQCPCYLATHGWQVQVDHYFVSCSCSSLSNSYWAAQQQQTSTQQSRKRVVGWAASLQVLDYWLLLQLAILAKKSLLLIRVSSIELNLCNQQNAEFLVLVTLQQHLSWVWVILEGCWLAF